MGAVTERFVLRSTAAAERDSLLVDLEFVPLGVNKLNRAPDKIRPVIVWRNPGVVSHYVPLTRQYNSIRGITIGIPIKTRFCRLPVPRGQAGIRSWPSLSNTVIG